MCEFNIQEIELFNYRQFEDKKFVLNSRMNVLQERMALVKQQYWKQLMSCWGHILQRLRHMYLPGLCLISNQLMQDERLRFQMIAEFLLLVQSHSILARLVVRLHGILIMSLLVFSVFF